MRKSPRKTVDKEEYMEKFAIGLLLGGVGGALLTANSYRMRMLVKKSQEEVQQKLDKFMDDKLDDMEKDLKKAAEKAKDNVDDIKEKAKDSMDDIKKTLKKKSASKNKNQPAPATN